MKSILVAIGLVLAGSSAASAAGAIRLASNTCWSAGGGNTASFGCNTNTGSNVFYGSVVAPTTMPQFLGATSTLLLKVDAGTIPPWWQIQPAGCRSNLGLLDSSPANMDGACPDIWGGNEPLPVTLVGPDVFPNMLRLTVSATLTPDLAQNIVADGVTELNLFRLVLGHGRTVGASACTGCSTGACLVFSNVQLTQPSGVGDFVLGTEAGGHFWITWNGGVANAPCAVAVPARNRTWGAVKSLYR